MSEVIAQKKKKPVRKIVSNVLSWFFGALVVLLLGCQVIMLTSSTYRNFQVPSLFGYSFMKVLTNSMEGDNPDSLPTNTGVVMRQTAAKEIKVHDVITFKSDYLSSKAGGTIVVSHRVSEIMVYPSEEDGNGKLSVSVSEEYSSNNGATWTASDGQMMDFKGGTNVRVRSIEKPEGSVVSYTIPYYTEGKNGLYMFFTIGDNLNADTCKYTSTGTCTMSYRDTIKEDHVIGKIVYHSDTLGYFLGLALSSWFVPVCCLVPLAIIVTFSAIDLVKEGRNEEKEEERQILLEANKMGVDPNDERAFYLFSEKQRYKIQVRNELEKAKAAERKRILREMKKKGNGTATMEVKS
jgi:signal peptidase I